MPSRQTSVVSLIVPDASSFLTCAAVSSRSCPSGKSTAHKTSVAGVGVLAAAGSSQDLAVGALASGAFAASTFALTAAAAILELRLPSALLGVAAVGRVGGAAPRQAALEARWRPVG